MKNLIRKILKEETPNKFIDNVLKWVKEPYFKNMEGLALTDNEYKLILSKIFDQPVTVKDDDVYNTNGNKIYYEDSYGYWIKYGYDANGNEIYFENSNGDWYKGENDDQGNLIYFEDNNGYWYKKEYDTNGNVIYYENSNGYWRKHEFDEQGNEIYFEDSHGNIIDKRGDFLTKLNKLN